MSPAQGLTTVFLVFLVMGLIRFVYRFYRQRAEVEEIMLYQFILLF